MSYPWDAATPEPFRSLVCPDRISHSGHGVRPPQLWMPILVIFTAQRFALFMVAFRHTGGPGERQQNFLGQG